jgi:hypothetical protein
VYFISNWLESKREAFNISYDPSCDKKEEENKSGKRQIEAISGV